MSCWSKGLAAAVEVKLECLADADWLKISIVIRGILLAPSSFLFPRPLINISLRLRPWLTVAVAARE